MHQYDYSDKEQGIKKSKAHQGNQAKGKKRNYEQKSQTNVNFEQGGRLDDEAQDQSLYDAAGYKDDGASRYRDTEKSKTRGASDMNKNDDADDAANDQ